MIEQIAPNVFRITVPLPKSPLKYLNAYVLRGTGRHCLIDTGLNRTACQQALNEGLSELNIDVRQTDIIVTHMHSDHSGLVPQLYAQGARILMTRPDAEVIIQPADWSGLMDFACLNGLPREDMERAKESNPGYKYRPQGDVQVTELKEGDVVSYAGLNLHCLLTPGHTTGHLCLYEPECRLLFAGDTILEEITPNISQWRPGRNPLQDYLNSLDRLYELEVSQVFPGHRRLFSGHQRRIDELRTHHRHRLDEVMGIVRSSSGHAFHIASRMTWDLDTKDWERFPLAQKWFATGEALAHLTYLESKGHISQERENGVVIWRA